MVPLLILIVSVVTWLVVGRALAPVERMRREVDEVTSRNLHRRIDDPGRSDEIGRLARTMNRMLERLEQSQRSQRRFISDASHELKSPLASLRQYAEVARSHPDRISADDLSRAVLDEGGRLERLVAGMLVLARADEQSLEVKAREVDLDDLVLAEGRRLRTSTELDLDATEVGAARVLGDGALLAQMVRNLVDNAAQHARSQVRLRLSATESTAVLAVEDDGLGVPVEDRERVFERFARLDESRTRNSGGSGLGLSIVQEIVSAHHGTVQISDSPLGGVCIEVRIPSSA
nr:ATP-binding protein [Arthrobacter pigmenti]